MEKKGNFSMKKTIFAVDDNMSSLLTAEEALEEYYNVITIPSGQRTIILLEKIRPDLILLDIEMEGMNGIVLLQYLKNDDKFKDIPIIFLTGTGNPQIESKVLEMGAVDFVTKPFSVPVLLNRVKLHIDMSEVIRERIQQLNRAKEDILFILADALENRDKSTGEHLEHTSKLVKVLIEKMLEEKVYYDRIKDWDPHFMSQCSLLHDIGKIRISDTILNKPGKLTPEEFEIMKYHALSGKKIIEKIINRSGDNMFLSNAIIFTTYHHERWNGTGYPFALIGEKIPLQGRIMAVVDVYDALIAQRVYKKALSKEQAIDIILKERGQHFDPKIADVFLKIL